MTTSVKVKVPEGANWDALVSIQDHLTDGETKLIRSQPVIVRPGQEYEVHVTDTREVHVREKRHA